jgi:hypothetical protein
MPNGSYISAGAIVLPNQEIHVLPGRVLRYQGNALIDTELGCVSLDWRSHCLQCSVLTEFTGFVASNSAKWPF